MASGATCVQRLDGSRDSAIHTKYRISLRSSSMQEPRYPLPRVVQLYERLRTPTPLEKRAGTCAPCSIFPWRVLRRGSLFDEQTRHVARKARAHPLGKGKMEGEAARPRPAHPPREYIQVRGFSAWQVFDNDPSAGSPTETLLRLLLPLNDKVQWTSRDVAGSEPPTSPRSEHFTGPFNR